MDKTLKFSIRYNIIYNKKANIKMFDYYLNLFKINVNFYNFLYNEI